MGNCKKQDRKRPELDINEISKRIKFESKQIQKTFGDIEELLKKSQRLMQRLLTNRNNRMVNGNTFFNVAEAPAAAPIVPIPPQTPEALLQITDFQRILLINISEQLERLQTLRAALRAILVSGAATISEISEEAPVQALIFAEILAEDLSVAQREIQEVRNNLRNLVLTLAGTFVI